LTSTPIIDPINKKPVIKCYFYPNEFYFENTNQIQDGLLILKQTRGYVWKLNLTISDNGQFDAYIDHQLNGNYQTEFSKYGALVQVPIQVYCPTQINNGSYVIRYRLSYNDYLDVNNVEHHYLTIYVGESPVAGFPMSYAIVSLVIVSVVTYLYMQEKKLLL